MTNEGCASEGTAFRTLDCARNGTFLPEVVAATDESGGFSGFPAPDFERRAKAEGKCAGCKCERSQSGLYYYRSIDWRQRDAARSRWVRAQISCKHAEGLKVATLSRLFYVSAVGLRPLWPVLPWMSGCQL